MLRININKRIKNINPVYENWVYNFIFISALVLISFKIYAQDSVKTKFSDNDSYDVKWISQFPSVEKEKHVTNIFSQIANWVVGKKDVPALIRPISILASNPDSFLIVDQGNRIILDVQNNKSNLLKFFKKNTNIFSSLVDICLLPDNEILFSDSRTNKIYSFYAGKKKFHVFNDSVELQQPTGIAYSKATDEIWVTETSAHRIAILDRNGKLKKRIGGRGESKGEFNFPTFICIDNAGDVYVNDAMNFRIQILNKAGEFVSAFGKPGDATGYFASSKGIALDSHQNIYVVDALFNTVQIFDRSGNFLHNFGEQGREKSQFWLPAGIYIDGKDFIYIADSYNARVQIFQLVKSDIK